MSTRAVIACGPSSLDFEGVYHHWDGYPSGLGKTLLELWRETFGRDYERARQALVRDHPGGYGTIIGDDGPVPWPTDGKPPMRARPGREPHTQAACYCHLPDGSPSTEPASQFRPSDFVDGDGPGVCYLYILTPGGFLQVHAWDYESRKLRFLDSIGVAGDAEPDWASLQGFPE